ncbi:MAG: hypothetical protein WBF06_01695 [Candidatus Acidiferrales bacterium]
MTRSGSLAYYLASWICGCFFLALAVWAHAATGGHSPLHGSSGASNLLTVYFFSLIFGFLDSIIGGFLLRRVAIVAHFARAWQWAAAGAVLAPLEIYAFARWGDAMLWQPGNMPSVWSFFVLAPMIVEREAAWLAAPAGALAALVLFSIHKAFGPKPEDASASPTGPASPEPAAQPKP